MIKKYLCEDKDFSPEWLKMVGCAIGGNSILNGISADLQYYGFGKIYVVTINIESRVTIAVIDGERLLTHADIDTKMYNDMMSKLNEI